MKKFDAKFMIIQIVILIAVSYIVSLIVVIANGGNRVAAQSLTLFPLFLLIVCVVYLRISNVFTEGFAKKTMKKNAAENGIGDENELVSEYYGMAGFVVRVDAATGRLAYVSFQNPFEFQLVNAREMAGIDSGYVKGPLGGTRYVYFEFHYNNKKVRIPTFASRNMYSLKSQAVQDAIAKADEYRNMLLSAQNPQASGNFQATQNPGNI